jgi:hypothetical protein
MTLLFFCDRLAEEKMLKLSSLINPSINNLGQSVKWRLGKSFIFHE